MPSAARLIDTYSAGHMIGAVPEEKETRAASRYETVIATFIALLAVCVAGYTAYMQRQQYARPYGQSWNSTAAMVPTSILLLPIKGRPGDHTACHREGG